MKNLRKLFSHGERAQIKDGKQKIVYGYGRL